MCSETNALGVEKEIINEEFGLSSGDTVVVKVGSNVLAGNDDGVNKDNLINIVNEISYLMEIGLNVILVSSGAVAVGKNILNNSGKKYGNNLTAEEKSYLSTIGQGYLMNFYINLFSQKKIIVGQGLLTHKNTSGKIVYSNLLQHFENKTLAILNENDFVSLEELKGFSDNDELAGLVSKEIKAKCLILLSDINGIYKNFGTKDEKIVLEINDISKYRKYCIDSNEKGVGKGGMNSKLNVMQEMMNNGIIGVLTNGGEKDILQKILKGEDCKKTIFRV